MALRATYSQSAFPIVFLSHQNNEEMKIQLPRKGRPFNHKVQKQIMRFYKFNIYLNILYTALIIWPSQSYRLDTLALISAS